MLSTNKQFGIIYKVTNKITKQCYVGQTTQKLSKRKYRHYQESCRNLKNSYLHRAISKYGMESFIWEELLNCDISMLDIMEIFKIMVTHSHWTEGGYNLTWGGHSGRGNCYTEEIIEKSLEYRKSGMTFFDIGKIVNVPPNTIYDWALKFSVNVKVIPRHNKISDDIIQKAIDLRNKKMSYCKIAKVLNVSPMTIYKNCKDIQIPSKYSIDIKNNAVRLRQSGLTWKETSKKTNIPESTIRDWCKNFS